MIDKNGAYTPIMAKEKRKKRKSKASHLSVVDETHKGND